MRHLTEAVAKRTTGKYDMFPTKYEKVTKEFMLSLFKRLGYDNSDNADEFDSSIYISSAMYEYCAKGRGIYTMGRFDKNKYSQWFRFCAPKSRYVFFIRMPGVVGGANNFWFDHFKSNGSFEQCDEISFDEFRSAVIYELGLE